MRAILIVMLAAALLSCEETQTKLYWDAGFTLHPVHLQTGPFYHPLFGSLLPNNDYRYVIEHDDGCPEDWAPAWSGLHTTLFKTGTTVPTHCASPTFVTRPPRSG
jgi:hypothetical protein